MRALIVTVLVVVGCKSDDEPGWGWWCYSWSYEGQQLGTCARAKQVCEGIEPFQDDGKTYVTGAQIRGVTHSGMIHCTQQPFAACFSVTDRMSEKKAHACSADFGACEQLRSLATSADTLTTYCEKTP